jgi:hypothetical protein
MKDLLSTPRLFFMHIPKTAGSSVAKYLRHRYAGLAIYEQDKDNYPAAVTSEFVNLPEAQRHSYHLVRGHMLYQTRDAMPADTLMLTFLREPVACCLSGYYHVLRRANHPLKALYTQFSLRELLHQPKFTMLALHRYLLPVDIYQKPPPLLAVDAAQKAQARERLQSIAVVGVTEQSEQSFELLNHVMGWPDAKLPQVNIKPPSQPTETLTSAEMDALHSCLAPDIELYEFGKRLFNERYQHMLRTRRQYAHFEYHLKHQTEGNGWHNSDSERGAWTGPETQSLLRLPLDRTVPLQLTIRVNMAVVPALLDGVRLIVDGQLCPHETVLDADPQTRHFIATLPPRGPSPHYTRVVIYTPQTYHVNRLYPQNASDKMIGIRVEWVTVQPIS